jgi:hypothetical protein
MGGVVVDVLNLPAPIIGSIARNRERKTNNVLLQFTGAENPAVLGSLDFPDSVFPEHDDMARVTKITRFRVGYAPIKSFGTRNTTTIEHPPEGHNLVSSDTI